MVTPTAMRRCLFRRALSSSTGGPFRPAHTLCLAEARLPTLPLQRMAVITATEEGGAIAVEAQKRPDASAEECAAPEAMPPAVAEVLAVLRSASFEVVGAPIDADAPLIEAGLDSATLGEFQGLVSERLSSSRLSSGRFSSGAPLPETLVFEHPTLRQLAAAIGGDDRFSQQINGDSSMPVARDASTVLRAPAA